MSRKNRLRGLSIFADDWILLKLGSSSLLPSPSSYFPSFRGWSSVLSLFGTTSSSETSPLLVVFLLVVTVPGEGRKSTVVVFPSSARRRRGRPQFSGQRRRPRRRRSSVVVLFVVPGVDVRPQPRGNGSFSMRSRARSRAVWELERSQGGRRSAALERPRREEVQWLKGENFALFGDFYFVFYFPIFYFVFYFSIFYLFLFSFSLFILSLSRFLGAKDRRSLTASGRNSRARNRS